MPTRHKPKRRFANPDWRARHHFPAPPIEEMEQRPHGFNAGQFCRGSCAHCGCGKES